MRGSYLVVAAALAGCVPQRDTRPARRPARPLEVVIGRDELLALPLPSTRDAAAMAPGGRFDGHGVAYGGTTGLDTRYALDGADTTDPARGGPGSLLPRELIGELAALGAGAPVSYGPGIGGFVSLTSPSGGDDFHGSVFGATSPGMLAAARRTAAQRDTIAISPRRGGTTSFGATLGGPIVKHRLWFFAGIAPQLSRVEYTRTVQSQADCVKPRPGGARSPCEAGNADGVPDTDPLTREPILVPVDSEVRSASASSVPAVGRLDLALPHDTAMLSAVVVPWSDEHPELVGAVTAGHVTTGLASDLAARWTHHLLGDRALVAAAAGWHRASSSDHALYDGVADLPQEIVSASSLADLATLGGESEETVRRCTDGATGDRFPLIPNCPAPFDYATGGPGLLVDDLADRRVAAVTAALDGLFVGLAASRERVSYEQRFSGGMQAFRDVDAPAPDLVEYRGMLASPGDTDPAYDHVCTLDDGTMRRCRLDGTRNDAESLAWSAYIADRLHPVRGLELELGLRYDAQQLRFPADLRGRLDPITGEPRGTTAIALGAVSGAAGVSYDPTHEGRARLFGLVGRHTEPLALDVITSHFGRGIQLLDSPIFGTRTSRTWFDLDPALRAGFVDEALAGGELEAAGDLWLGAAAVHRAVGRAIDDVGEDGGAFLLTNPDDATRTYDALAVTARHRLGAGFYVQASYTYSRTRGSYTGVVEDGGYANAHASPQLDSFERRTNATGPLPQDRPHLLKADAFYELPLGPRRALVLGSRLRVVSGTPRTAIDGLDRNFLLPRGALGRTPLVEALDLHLAVRGPLSRRFVGELYADVFDLFDDQAVYAVDDTYDLSFSTGAAPISGGSAEDLVWLKERDAGRPVIRNAHAGEPRAFYSGRYVTLGGRILF